MSVLIEPLVSLDEIEDILVVERTAFTNPWTREMYVAAFENSNVSRILVARDRDGRTTGFCSYWLVLDEMHFNNLAVLPAHRRQGIASALLTRALAEGRERGASRATLEVRRSNDAARRLYEQFDFVMAGVRRGYYTHPPEDALVLWREHLDITGS